MWPLSWMFDPLNPYLNDNRMLYIFGNFGFKFLDRERKVAMATALLATILGCAATWFEVLATTGTGDITLELTAWGTATSRFDDDTNGGGQVAFFGLRKLVVGTCAKAPEGESWHDWRQCSFTEELWDDVSCEAEASHLFGFSCDAMESCRDAFFVSQIGMFIASAAIVLALPGCLARMRRKADTNWQKLLALAIDVISSAAQCVALVSFVDGCSNVIPDKRHDDPGVAVTFTSGWSFKSCLVFCAVSATRAFLHLCTPIPGGGSGCLCRDFYPDANVMVVDDDGDSTNGSPRGGNHAKRRPRAASGAFGNDATTTSRSSKKRLLGSAPNRLDPTLLRKRVVLRGGVYNKRTNALGVPGLQGMGAQVLLVDNASNTYRLALDDGHIVNLSHSELFGHGPSYNRAGRAAARRCLPPQPHSHLPSAHRALPPVLASPQDSSVNSFSNASSSSYARGGSEETKEEMPFDHRSGHHNMNLAMVNKHNKSSSSSSRAHSSSSFSASAAAGMLHTGPMPSSQFYPQGAAPPPRPILNQGDECFVRDGNDSWRPGVVEALDPSDPIRGRPKVRLHGWPRAYVWDDYRLAKPKRTTRKADTAHDASSHAASEHVLTLTASQLAQASALASGPKLGDSIHMAREATGDARWGQGCLGPVESKLFKLRSKHYLDKSSSKSSSSSAAAAKKLPSAPPLFEFAGADCVLSQQGPVYNFAKRVKLPPLPAPPSSVSGAESANANYEHYGKSTHKSSRMKVKNSNNDNTVNHNPTTVPAYIIINMQMPLEAKSLFGGNKRKSPVKASKNGGGGASDTVSSSVPACNAVYYFRISPSTAKHMLALDEELLEGGKKARNVPPACRLLHNWCRLAPTDASTAGRFKALGIGHNFDDVGAPTFVKAYNGKPVLMAHPGKHPRQGFSAISFGRNYMEVDIDIGAHFSYLAQKGMAWGMSMCERLHCSLGFVIEGQSEDELPEVLLGCCTHMYLPAQSTINDTTFFGALSSPDAVAIYDDDEEDEEEVDEEASLNGNNEANDLYEKILLSKSSFSSSISSSSSAAHSRRNSNRSRKQRLSANRQRLKGSTTFSKRADYEIRAAQDFTEGIYALPCSLLGVPETGPSHDAAAVAAAPPFQQNLWAAGAWANAVFASTAAASLGSHNGANDVLSGQQYSSVCIADPSIGTEADCVEVVSDHEATMRWLGIDQVPPAVIQAGLEPGTAVYRRYTKSHSSLHLSSWGDTGASNGAVSAAGSGSNPIGNGMTMIHELSKSLDELAAMVNSTNASTMECKEHELRVAVLTTSLLAMERQCSKEPSVSTSSQWQAAGAQLHQDILAAVARTHEKLDEKHMNAGGSNGGSRAYRHVVHAGSLDFRKGPPLTRSELVEALSCSYAAILEAFATMATSSGSSSGGHTTSILRLSPLARGPEMGSAVWQLPQLTFEALRNAYGMLGAAPRATLKSCTVFLCVPDGRACRRYWTAGFLGPGGRKTLPTAPEDGEEGQLQINQSGANNDIDDDDGNVSVSTSVGAAAIIKTTPEEDARMSGADTWVVGDRCEVVDDNGESATVPDEEAAWEPGSVVRVDARSGKPLVQRDGFDEQAFFARVRRLFGVGNRVQVCDEEDAEWCSGTVTNTESFDGRPRVQLDGYDPPGYIYDYCRRLWAVGESVEVKDKDDDDGWSPGVIEEVDYFGTPKVKRTGGSFAFQFDFVRRNQKEPILLEGDDEEDEEEVGLFDYAEGTEVQGEVVSNDEDDDDDSIALSRRSSRPPSRPSSRPSSRPTSRPSSRPSSRPGSRYGTPQRRRTSSGNLSLAESEDSGWAEMGIVGGPTRNTDRYDDNEDAAAYDARLKEAAAVELQGIGRRFVAKKELEKRRSFKEADAQELSSELQLESQQQANQSSKKSANKESGDDPTQMEMNARKHFARQRAAQKALEQKEANRAADAAAEAALKRRKASAEAARIQAADSLASVLSSFDEQVSLTLLDNNSSRSSSRISSRNSSRSSSNRVLLPAREEMSLEQKRQRAAADNALAVAADSLANALNSFDGELNSSVLDSRSFSRSNSNGALRPVEEEKGGDNSPSPPVLPNDDGGQRWAVGDAAQCRDHGDAEWADGFVTEVDEFNVPRVQQNGFDKGYLWDQTRRYPPVQPTSGVSSANASFDSNAHALHFAAEMANESNLTTDTTTGADGNASSGPWIVGESVEVKDDDDEEWGPGIVSSVESDGAPRVTKEGYDKGFLWDQIRRPSQSPPSYGAPSSNASIGDDGDNTVNSVSTEITSAGVLAASATASVTNEDSLTEPWVVGESVEVKDDDDEEWGSGVIISVESDGAPRVIKVGYDKDYVWDQCRRPVNPWVVGEKVEVRDADTEDWGAGVVDSLDSDGAPKVVKDGFDKAYLWNQCRRRDGMIESSSSSASSVRSSSDLEDEKEKEEAEKETALNELRDTQREADSAAAVIRLQSLQRRLNAGAQVQALRLERDKFTTVGSKIEDEAEAEVAFTDTASAAIATEEHATAAQEKLLDTEEERDLAVIKLQALQRSKNAQARAKGLRAAQEANAKVAAAEKAAELAQARADAAAQAYADECANDDDETARVRQRFKDACAAAKVSGALHKTGFKTLVQALMVETNQVVAASDADLEEAFWLADEDQSMLIDEREFLRLYRVVRSPGGINGLGMMREKGGDTDQKTRRAAHFRASLDGQNDVRLREQYRATCSRLSRDYLNQESFRDLVKQLLHDSGRDLTVSDADLNKAFRLSDVEESKLMNENEFVVVYNLLLGGHVAGLGKSSILESPLVQNRRKLAFRGMCQGVNSESPAEELNRVEARFHRACDAVGAPWLDQSAFCKLVQALMMEKGQKETSSADLETAFLFADEDQTGFIDRDEFMKLYEFIKAGKIRGLGNQGSLFESNGSKAQRAAAFRGILHGLDQESPEEEAARIQGRFQKACQEAGVRALHKTAFRKLVKALMMEAGQMAASDADLEAAFHLADEDESMLIDRDEFGKLYQVIKAGKVQGLGKKSMFESAEQKEARVLAFKGSLEVANSNQDAIARVRHRFQKACQEAGVRALHKTAFKKLVKTLILEAGRKSASDADLEAAFILADEDESMLIDEKEFLVLFQVIKAGKIAGLGSKGLFETEAQREKRVAAFRKSLGAYDSEAFSESAPLEEENEGKEAVGEVVSTAGDEKGDVENGLDGDDDEAGDGADSANEIEYGKAEGNSIDANVQGLREEAAAEAALEVAEDEMDAALDNQDLDSDGEEVLEAAEAKREAAALRLQTLQRRLRAESRVEAKRLEFAANEVARAALDDLVADDDDKDPFSLVEDARPESQERQGQQQQGDAGGEDLVVVDDEAIVGVISPPASPVVPPEEQEEKEEPKPAPSKPARTSTSKRSIFAQKKQRKPPAVKAAPPEWIP